MLVRARPFKVEDTVLQNKPVRRVQKIVIKATAEVHHLSHVHQTWCFIVWCVDCAASSIERKTGGGVC